MTKAFVLVMVVALGACAPYYRDLENRGRFDPKALSSAQAKASRAASAGDHSEAARIMRAYLDTDPASSDFIYTAWADYAVAAGQKDRARAVIRWRASETSSTVLRGWLVKTYVADGWVARAIEETRIDLATFNPIAEDPGYVDTLLIPYPELKTALAPLLEAYAMRFKNQPEQMLALLLRWNDTYGKADSRFIDKIADVVGMYLNDSAYYKRFVEIVARADKLVDTEPHKALMLYSEAFRHGVSVPDAPLKKATSAVQDMADTDPVAAQWVADGDRLVAAGELAKGLALYRRALLRAPWWRDIRKRASLVLEAMGAADAATFVR
jgi:hypothetical protein